MNYKISDRGQVSSFKVMDIMRAANKIETAGKSVIHFEVGQPYMGIPESTHDFVKNIITNKELGYTDSCGIPELRENISSYYNLSKVHYRQDLCDAMNQSFFLLLIVRHALNQANQLNLIYHT